MFIENTEELAQNKLLLLYIIEKANRPLDNQELTNFILEKNYINYFLIQQYLSELSKTGFIEYVDLEGKKSYRLLEKGQVTLSYFEDRIDKKVKKELSDEFGLDSKKEVEKEIIGEYFKKEDYNYVVNLKLKENSETLFSLYLNLPNEDQAQLVCKKWKENPEEIYKNIINSVLEEEII